MELTPLTEDYPLVSDTGKRYRLVSGSDGNEYHENESGAGRDPARQVNVRGTITAENAKVMQSRAIASKYEKAEQRIREGLVAGLSEHEIVKRVSGKGQISVEDIWAAIGVEQAKLAMDTEKGHASTKAAEFIGKRAGLIPDGNSRVEMEDADGNRLRVPDLATLLELRREIQQGNE